MKILAINGSHRGDKGHTYFLLERLAKGAAAGGAEFDIVSLSEVRITPCSACDKCKAPDHFLKCVFEEKDDMRGILDKMIQADLFVFATPIYIFTITGLFKNFLDRMYATADNFDLKLTQSGLFFHDVNRDISSKPFVTLICCDNIEKETPQNAISYFRTYAKFHDAQIVGELVRNAGRFSGHGKDPDAYLRAPKLAETYSAFELAGRELAETGRISTATQKRASQNILPLPPFMKLLKNLRPIKENLINRARMMNRGGKGITR